MVSFVLRTLPNLLFCIIIINAVFPVCASEPTASPIAIDENFWQQLRDEKKSIELIDQYIKSDIDLTIRDNQGSSLLHYAVRFGNVMLAKKLLENKFNPNLINVSGETPLYEALMGENEDLVLLLLRFGAYVQISVKNGKESLWQRAVALHKSNFFKCLIAYGCCVNFDNKEEKTAFYEVFPSLQDLLWYALELRNTRCIEYAIALGADINAHRIIQVGSEQREMIPLEYAIWHDHAESALVLLRLGARVDQIDLYIRGCIRQACVAQARKVIPFLIAYGANLNPGRKEERAFIREAVPNTLEYTIIYDELNLLRKRRQPLEEHQLLLLKQASNSTAIITNDNDSSSVDKQHALSFAVGRLNKELVMQVLALIPQLQCNPMEAYGVFKAICGRGDAKPKTCEEHKQIEVLIMTRVLLFRNELRKIFNRSPFLFLPRELRVYILSYILEPSVFYGGCYSPLYEAIEVRDNSLVRWVLKEGFSAVNGLPMQEHSIELLSVAPRRDVPNADAKFTQSGDTPLHYAAAHSLNHISIVRSLIQYGANVNAKDSNFKQTPLHKACAGFATEIVKYLLENGALITSDSKGKKPQHIANEIGAHGCAMLIEKWLGDSEIEEAESLEIVNRDRRRAFAKFLKWYDKLAFKSFGQSPFRKPWH